MVSILFLLNENIPNKEKYLSLSPIAVSNFTFPNSLALQQIDMFHQYQGLSRRYAQEIECTNAPIHFLDIPIYRNILDIKNILIAYKRINKHIKELNIDYIHCNTPLGGFLGRVCGKRCNVQKVIYTAHGFHFYKGAPSINWLLFYPIERFLARWTDALLVMNDEDYSITKKFKLRDEGKIFKVPGVGIDLNGITDGPIVSDIRKELELPDSSKLCISMGDLNKNKNCEVVIRAFASVDSDVHYLICGIGPEKEKLEEISTTLGISKNVHFLGFRRDIVSLLKQSDVFILSSFREGLPRSTMEAMACGLPCVVSEIRGNVDLIEEGINGLLCKPTDTEGFSNAINRLCQNQSLRESMGKYSLEKIKGYDTSVVTQKLEEIYREVLK